MDRKPKIKAIIDRNIRDIVLANANNKIGFVSVNNVEVSNDYSVAKVYVSFLGSKDAKKSFDKLVQMAPYLRHELAQKLSIYKTPEIRFIHDQRFIIDEKMNDLLKKDHAELEKIKKKK
ncbi:MAG: 30S ribosome-binding factor RbfA [Bacilli bacterium]|nr:30S ribosome-binding factor RbfA [Bacilli bacterium]